jgi:hypothetical protein
MADAAEIGNAVALHVSIGGEFRGMLRLFVFRRESMTRRVLVWAGRVGYYIGLLAFVGVNAVCAAQPPCTAEPRAKWMPREAVRGKIEALGYQIRDFEVENACYAVEVHDKNGKELDLYVDPMTGKIVKIDEDN